MICVNSVSVYPKTISLKVGTWSYAVYAEICPSNADCRSVRWYSDNPSIASVNASTGYICANAIGTTKIYATAIDGSGCTDCITVTVNNKISVTSVTLNEHKITLEKNESAILTAGICPDNATNKKITWSSANHSIATVNNGVVTGVGKGSTKIYATAADGSENRDYCKVTITDDVLVKCITVIPANKTMMVGTSTFLSATVSPSNATQKSVCWCSSNPNIATVNELTGLVMAQQKGETVISATACDGSGVVGVCRLTVTKPISVEDITLSSSDLFLYKGNTHKLTAVVCPINATNKSVCWQSTRPTVASVNASSGKITARAAGKAIIYAIAKDGSGVRACCSVVVKQTVLCPTEETPVNKVQGSTFADPVDVYSGAHMLSNTLMSLFGGQGIKLVAQYNSAQLACGLFGSGWYHNYEK